MEKKLYWLVESNYDLSVTTPGMELALLVLQNDFDSLHDDDKEERVYKITPQMLTLEEYESLDEIT